MCVFNGVLCVWDGISHVSLTLFHLCTADFGKVLLALILVYNSKSSFFEKIYTKSSVFSIRTPIR